MKSSFFLLITMLLLLSLQACAHPMYYRSKEFSGSVVDATTNEPIEGVVVVAQWIPRSWKVGEMGHYGLVEIYEALTDKDGKYIIPGWGPKLREPGTYLDEGEPEISLFKKGYWYLRVVNDGKGEDSSLRESVWDGRNIKLKRFGGEPAEVHVSRAYDRPGEWHEIKTVIDDDYRLNDMLSDVEIDIFHVFTFGHAGGRPIRRIKHLAKEWNAANKELKKPRHLPDVIEKMLKEEYKDE